MKKSTGIILIILLLVIAYLLNPKFEKHLEKTGVGNLEKTVTPDLKSFVASNIYVYNNYYIFSTTTNKLTGQRATFGLFGVVFN